MLKSLALYLKYTTTIAFRKERKIVLEDINRYQFNPTVFLKIPEYTREDLNKALSESMEWLLYAQKKTDDGGVSSYHMAKGWSSSYPETSGYIIPGLLNYAMQNNRQDMIAPALNIANWLVSIQADSGGWQGGRISENKPETVFNTGQVVRGLIAAYEYASDEKYLQAFEKGCNWLCQVQDPKGYWKKYALMNAFRVYDSYVDAPLLHAFNITKNKMYKECAIQNLEWIINEKQQNNGWFEDCDNTEKRNEKPIIHTIAYTLDGLIDSGFLLNEMKYVEAAKKAADVLMELFLRNGYLNGRYDRNWNGSEYFICTGGAQMAIVWMKLFEHYAEECYIESASRMINLLVFIQQRTAKETGDTRGALPGSFPVWGKYEPFAFPNWASKYFADAIMKFQEFINPDKK